MQDAEAVPALEGVLKDLSLYPIVRHEAAEALGAIGLESIVPLLEQSLVSDPALEVRQTCELALRRIKGQQNITSGDGTSAAAVSPFLSVDPAMTTSPFSSIDQLREVLLNENEGMYERYAALFSLRNNGVDAAVSAIIASLGARSALLRHEVAYVLGQLQNKAADSTLSEILRNVNEHPLVRHEAAKALGSIADAQWHSREDVKKALTFVEHQKAKRTAVFKVNQMCKGAEQGQNFSSDFNVESGELSPMFIPGPFAIAHHLISSWAHQNMPNDPDSLPKKFSSMSSF